VVRSATVERRSTVGSRSSLLDTGVLGKILLEPGLDHSYHGLAAMSLIDVRKGIFQAHMCGAGQVSERHRWGAVQASGAVKVYVTTRIEGIAHPTDGLRQTAPQGSLFKVCDRAAVHTQPLADQRAPEQLPAYPQIPHIIVSLDIHKLLNAENVRQVRDVFGRFGA
jgi:hypothetical protein